MLDDQHADDPTSTGTSHTTGAENLDAVFKAYDVRGLVGDQIDEALARAVGVAFVAETGASRVVVGHDMRSSSPSLAGAFGEGATEAGADVVMIGLASTDQLYFASGQLDLAGVMFTASHNPAAYNGIKMCRAGAVPLGQETGLAAIRDRIASGTVVRAAAPGALSTTDVLAAYAAHLLTLAPVTGRRLRVVVDAGNGMAGHTAPAVFGRLGDQVDMVPLYFELDGTFPNHEANPIEPENLADLQKAVLSEGADIGLAFDGDADRCFLVDEGGRMVDPSTLTALIASRELARVPGASVIHNLITSRAVPEIVTELGGTPIRTRVGHSFIKATMAETDAVFGGEHSGHFYFRDFWRADSGMLAALHALAALAETERPLSELLAEFERYVSSGEVNSTVADQKAVVDELRASYTDRPGVTIDELDGLTVTHDDWWFNVRASNTEPLLRLNAEGTDEATMTRVRDDVLTVIRRDQ
ncbi:MAG: phosphomannomutase/phosphoglucomutase [Nocardioides sp.]